MITQLPQATLIDPTSDIGYIHQGGIDKQIPASLLFSYLLQAGNNLSDLSNKASARANLGVPSLAQALLVTNNLSDINNPSTARSNLGLNIGTNIQAWNQELDSLSANSTNTGLLAQTGAGTVASRALIPPAQGFTVTNPSGIAGNPTFALSNDLAALEALPSTGIATRIGVDSWAQRQLVSPADLFVIVNSDGVSGNPTFNLTANATSLLTLVPQVSSITSLVGITTGIVCQTSSGSWAARTILGTANQIEIVNGDGIADNPTLVLPNSVSIPSTSSAQSQLTFNAKTGSGGSTVLSAKPNSTTNVEIYLPVDATSLPSGVASNPYKALIALPASDGNHQTGFTPIDTVLETFHKTAVSTFTLTTPSSSNLSNNEFVIKFLMTNPTADCDIYFQFVSNTNAIASTCGYYSDGTTLHNIPLNTHGAFNYQHSLTASAGIGANTTYPYVFKIYCKLDMIGSPGLALLRINSTFISLAGPNDLAMSAYHPISSLMGITISLSSGVADFDGIVIEPAPFNF